MVTSATGADIIGPMYSLRENGAHQGGREIHASLLFRALGEANISASLRHHCDRLLWDKERNNYYKEEKKKVNLKI